MNREDAVNTLLLPVDQALGLLTSTVEKSAAASETTYRAVRNMLRLNFGMVNELSVEGIENIPAEGGVLLASNHQSWLDVQVLVAACPRRVHFIAKSEFQQWPVLRHLIKLSQSVFVRRGGDDSTLQTIEEALRRGWAIAIYPEGTIPGEEDVPRRAVDPTTGLLPGHTGVVRLALGAKVPIVPVGVSGTGRAFPPEVYPRLEMLRMPASTPIRIRFGKPISFEQHEEREHDRELFRELTNEVMHRISDLVDHRSNYAPIEVPIPPPPKHERIGVLLLHGFTSDVATVDGLIPYLEKAGIPYEMPILRGHGTRYQDLRGVKAQDWYVDAEWALNNLWNHVDRVVVVGLSMGGLVALELAMRHADKIAGLVSVAACLRFKDPLARLTGLVSNFVKYFPSPDAFTDKSLRVNSRNYPRFPVDAFASLYEYSQLIADRLGAVHVPIRILQSKKDTVTVPEAANIIYEKVRSPIREIIWYEESGHEMMQDLEAEKVFEDIMEFVHRFELHPQIGDKQTDDSIK